MSDPVRSVVVAGTGVAPFTKEPVDLHDIALDSGLAALRDAGCSFADVQAAYVGYIGAPIMTGTRVLKEFGLTGIPVQHVENASATGAAAFREAYLAVAGGHVDVAMAIAFDGLGRFPGPGAGGQRVAMGRNSLEGTILPAAFFAMWATRRMHDYGTTVETFARIAAKNWNHARHCAWAQRRADHEVTPDEVLASFMVAEPHTAMMSCAVGSGAAAAILVSSRYARRLDRRRCIKILASAMQSERYSDGHVFLGPVIGPPQMTADTAREAYEKAGIGPEDLDLVQVHDAFPIEELVYYELLGICREGEGDRLIADGETAIGGRIPFSTDGGLIARGHPGGPTGLAQIHETVTQLRGEAGARQVDGAKIGLCHLVGAGSVCVVHVLAR